MVELFRMHAAITTLSLFSMTEKNKYASASFIVPFFYFNYSYRGFAFYRLGI